MAFSPVDEKEIDRMIWKFEQIHSMYILNNVLKVKEKKVF